MQRTNRLSRTFRRYVNENRLRAQMIKTSTIKNLRRRNLEVIIEKHLLELEQERQRDVSRRQMSSTMLALKTITIGIILRVAGAIFQSLLSLSACVVYVVSTYYQDNTETEPIFAVFEILFATLFSIDYMIGFYNAKNKRKFVLSLHNIVDLLTILPVFVQYVPGGDTSAGDFLRRFIGVVRVLRVFRVLRMYRLFNSQSAEGKQSDAPFAERSEVQRKIIVISATILASVFIATGIIYSFNYLDLGFEMALPNEDEKLTFDSAFYFMIVTVCTVGYGDIIPSTDLARVIIGIFIIAIIVLVSKQTSELNELMKMSNKFCKPYTGPERSQIIIVGNITANSLNKFLKEFYHPDHNMKEEMQVVLIQDKEPSKELEAILVNPRYEEVLHYIQGNMFQEQTMKMAKVKENKIFIFCNQYSTDSKVDDTFALLATRAVHEYDPSAKIFVQLVDPEFLLHSWADWDIVMSTQAFKMGIIASNVFNPGFSAFVGNLCTSTSLSDTTKRKFPMWMQEYCNGVQQEFYTVSFAGDSSGKYIGRDFSFACQQIYIDFGILLIGVKCHGDTNQVHDILMNPIGYKIRATDEAIMISNNQESADNVFGEGPMRPLILQYFHQNMSRPPLIIQEEEIRELNYSKRITKSEGHLVNSVYLMWETDLRGLIKNHFIVFGPIDHLPALLLALKHYTTQTICFVSDKKADERWVKIQRNFRNVAYLECSLTNIDEIHRTAIADAFHIILLTWFSPDSAIQDSGILPVVRIVEEHFPSVPFTLELVDESNLKYLNYPPKKDFGSLAFNLWPRYGSSNVFFSSTLDNMMAQTFHFESIIDIIGKLINSNISPNISNVEENNEVTVIKLTDRIDGYKYIDLFRIMTSQRKTIIPLALVQQPKSNENELPLVLVNPAPLTPLEKGDMLLMMGVCNESDTSDITSSNLRYQETGQMTPEQLSKEQDTKRVDYNNTNDDIVTLAQRYSLIEQEEILNTEDPVIHKFMENELKMTYEDRMKLLKQNSEMRKILNEYFEVKSRVFY